MDFDYIDNHVSDIASKVGSFGDEITSALEEPRGFVEKTHYDCFVKLTDVFQEEIESAVDGFNRFFENELSPNVDEIIGSMKVGDDAEQKITNCIDRLGESLAILKNKCTKARFFIDTSSPVIPNESEMQAFHDSLQPLFKTLDTYKSDFQKLEASDGASDNVDYAVTFEASTLCKHIASALEELCKTFEKDFMDIGQSANKPLSMLQDKDKIKPKDNVLEGLGILTDAAADIADSGANFSDPASVIGSAIGSGALGGIGIGVAGMVAKNLSAYAVKKLKQSKNGNSDSKINSKLGKFIQKALKSKKNIVGLYVVAKGIGFGVAIAKSIGNPFGLVGVVKSGLELGSGLYDLSRVSDSKILNNKNVKRALRGISKVNKWTKDNKIFKTIKKNKAIADCAKHTYKHIGENSLGSGFKIISSIIDYAGA